MRMLWVLVLVVVGLGAGVLVIGSILDLIFEPHPFSAWYLLVVLGGVSYYCIQRAVRMWSTRM